MSDDGILIIAPEGGARDALVRQLCAARYYAVASSATELLATWSPLVVILDCVVFGEHTPRVVRELGDRVIRPAIIVLTDGDEIAGASMNAGASMVSPRPAEASALLTALAQYTGRAPQ